MDGALRPLLQTARNAPFWLEKQEISCSAYDARTGNSGGNRDFRTNLSVQRRIRPKPGILGQTAEKEIPTMLPLRGSTSHSADRERDTWCRRKSRGGEFSSCMHGGDSMISSKASPT